MKITIIYPFAELKPHLTSNFNQPDESGTFDSSGAETQTGKQTSEQAGKHIETGTCTDKLPSVLSIDSSLPSVETVKMSLLKRALQRSAMHLRTNKKNLYPVKTLLLNQSVYMTPTFTAVRKACWWF